MHLSQHMLVSYQAHTHTEREREREREREACVLAKPVWNADDAKTPRDYLANDLVHSRLFLFLLLIGQPVGDECGQWPS